MDEITDWSNLDLILWKDSIEKEFNSFVIEKGGCLGDLCDWNCRKCMDTFIDDIGTRLSWILCCSSHPETWEVNDKTWVCTNYGMETWKCRVYNTEEYPSACKNYHCKTHGF